MGCGSIDQLSRDNLRFRKRLPRPRFLRRIDYLSSFVLLGGPSNADFS